MLKNHYVIIAVIVLAVLGGIVYANPTAEPVSVQNIDHFNIGTDPVITKGPYKLVENVATCPKRSYVANHTQYGGLNPKHNSNLSVTDFINTYGTGENYNLYDTADVTSRRYCTMLYGVNNEYFSDRWSSLSECEVAIKEECQTLFPKAPKKVFFTTV